MHGVDPHCFAAPVDQAAWDLVTRDLTAPPFNMNSQTAFVVGNKLFYQGSGDIYSWYNVRSRPAAVRVMSRPTAAASGTATCSGSPPTTTTAA